MNLQPIVLAIALTDLLSTVTLGVALVGAIRVEIGWTPQDASRQQLALERLREESSALGRLGFALQVLSLFMAIVAINHVLPSSVPGAMCGAGVMQAMPDGLRAFAIRLVGLGGLWVWTVLDDLDRKSPLASLAHPTARALLVSVPVAAVGTWQGVWALLRLESSQEVSCCSALYQQAQAKGLSEVLWKASEMHAAVALVLGLLVIALAGTMRKGQKRQSGAWVNALTVLAFGWALLAGWVLLDWLSPYAYGVLGHRCPYCLFVPRHGARGYVLYGALLVTVFEALAAKVAHRVGAVSDDIRPWAWLQVRRSALRISVAASVFLIVAYGPALAWRFRYGVWLSP